MSGLSPLVNAALLGGGGYSPPLQGAGLGVATSSSLLSTLGGTSLGGVSQGILASAYRPLDVVELSKAYETGLDDTTLAAILQSTNAVSSASLYNSLGGASLYQDTLSLLNAVYPVNASLPDGVDLPA